MNIGYATRMLQESQEIMVVTTETMHPPEHCLDVFRKKKAELARVTPARECCHARPCAQCGVARAFVGVGVFVVVRVCVCLSVACVGVACARVRGVCVRVLCVCLCVCVRVCVCVVGGGDWARKLIQCRTSRRALHGSGLGPGPMRLAAAATMTRAARWMVT